MGGSVEAVSDSLSDLRSQLSQNLSDIHRSRPKPHTLSVRQPSICQPKQWAGPCRAEVHTDPLVIKWLMWTEARRFLLLLTWLLKVRTSPSQQCIWEPHARKGCWVMRNRSHPGPGPRVVGIWSTAWVEPLLWCAAGLSSRGYLRFTLLERDASLLWSALSWGLSHPRSRSFRFGPSDLRLRLSDFFCLRPVLRSPTWLHSTNFSTSRSTLTRWKT